MAVSTRLSLLSPPAAVPAPKRRAMRRVRHQRQTKGASTPSAPTTCAVRPLATSTSSIAAPATPPVQKTPCRSADTGACAKRRSIHRTRISPPVPSATQTTRCYPFGAGNCPAILRAVLPGNRVSASRPPAA